MSKSDLGIFRIGNRHRFQESESTITYRFSVPVIFGQNRWNREPKTGIEPPLITNISLKLKSYLDLSNSLTTIIISIFLTSHANNIDYPVVVSRRKIENDSLNHLL